MFGSDNGFLTLLKCYHKKHKKQFKHYDKIMKRAHGCSYHHCKPELKKTISQITEGPVKDNYQGSIDYLKLYIEAVTESGLTTAVQLMSAAYLPTVNGLQTRQCSNSTLHF